MIKSAVAAALIFSSLPCLAEVIAIVGATVIHPERELPAAVAANSTVIINGTHIERVGRASWAPVPKGSTRIGGTSKWVVPGLNDPHVHFFYRATLSTL